MGILVFIACIAAAVFSSWLFYRVGWYSLIVFLPLAAVPLFSVNQAGLLSLFIIPAAIGSIGGLCFKDGKDFGFFLIASSFLFSALFTTEYYVLKNFRNTDIIEKGRDEIVFMMEQGSGDIDRVFNEYKTPEENREKIRGEIAESIAILKDNKWVQFARDMIPFSAFLYGVAICGLSFAILRKYVMKNRMPQVNALEFLRVNDYFIFALIAGWGGFILLDSSKYPAFSIAALNIALIASTLYVAQALGIIKHFMIRKGIPALILPFIFLTLIFFGPPVIIFTTILLLGLGTLDLWADFRKLTPDKQRNNKE